MASSAMIAAIDELMLLTRKMLGHASKGAWDEVAPLEARRVVVIGSLPSVSDETNASAAAKLKQIIEINAEIVALAVAEKDKIADELRRSKKLEKADQAYRDTDFGPV